MWLIVSSRTRDSGDIMPLFRIFLLPSWKSYDSSVNDYIKTKGVNADIHDGMPQRLGTSSINIVIINLLCYGGNGFEIIHHLREWAGGHSLGIVALTRKDSASTVMALEAGADICLSANEDSQIVGATVLSLRRRLAHP
jgi:DNA-binding response OmpR family regulator